MKVTFDGLVTSGAAVAVSIGFVEELANARNHPVTKDINKVMTASTEVSEVCLQSELRRAGKEPKGQGGLPGKEPDGAKEANMARSHRRFIPPLPLGRSICLKEG